MNITVVIATHHRTEPLRRVLRNLPIAWQVVIAYTDAEELPELQALAIGGIFVQAPNSPLGAKWQAAVEVARTTRHDWLCIIGSDDVIRVQEDQLYAALRHHSMAGVRRWLIYDGHQHWQASYTHEKQPLGAGRFYRKDVLERMRYKLFDTAKNRGLDEYGYRNALRAGCIPLIVEDLPGMEIISLKGPWQQLNPLDKLLNCRTVRLQPLKHVRDSSPYQF